MVTVTYARLGYSEFENLVRKTFGHNYDFVGDIECSNDSDHSYENIFKKDLDTFEFKDLQKFTNTGEYSFISYTLIQDLVNKGLLPEGNILIQVSW